MKKMYDPKRNSEYLAKLDDKVERLKSRLKHQAETDKLPAKKEHFKRIVAVGKVVEDAGSLSIVVV